MMVFSGNGGVFGAECVVGVVVVGLIAWMG